MIPKKKIGFLVGILILYIALGVFFRLLVVNGAIPYLTIELEHDPIRLNVAERLDAATGYMNDHLVRADSHVYLYDVIGEGEPVDNPRATNSEAMSYYLLWTAQNGDKDRFDSGIAFVEQYMFHPDHKFMQWRVEENGSIVRDGGNVASDADLRMLKALFIAEDTWGDERYTTLIDEMAAGVEYVAITDDALLAPYGGIAGNPWMAREVWLSYADFTVFEELSLRRGEPWTSVYLRMKDLTLRAQIANGLYNSQLTENREYGNGIDGDGYSINSMWMMVRCAESDDPELRESARKNLAFYKHKFEIDNQIFSLYTSNGDALTNYDTPWVYALVGRAAAALNDRPFADAMLERLLEFQEADPESPLYGAFSEGSGESLRVGQFTMQESILTMQEYLKKNERHDPKWAG